MKSEEVYLELIEIGRNGKLKNLSKLRVLFPPKSSNAWVLYDKTLVQKYNSIDLLNLFRGMVICEKELKWHCGSTTPAAHLYQDIIHRNLDPDYSLADWAFQYSDNEYIPFGFVRHGERTAYEYIQWREEFHNRLIQEKIDKEERKKLQLERAEKIEKAKRENDKHNRQLYQKIMGLSPEEQISYILSDNKHNIYFYMPIIIGLLNNRLVTLHDLEKLLEKLKCMKKTPFNKKLVKQIIQKINEISEG